MSESCPALSAGATPVRGKLAGNIMHFARVLRQAGLPVGSGQILDALDAVRNAARWRCARTSIGRSAPCS